jgi:hypothetical protein
MAAKSYVGIEKLSEMLACENGSYGCYLNANKLPYISRDNYKKENPQHSDLISETELMDKIITSERRGGVMIYGDSGIGKTRLMVELGHMFEAKGWTAYNITHKLESLAKLKPLLKADKNYLLLFDSIENHPLFTCDIIEKLEKIAPGANIKLAGNCRNIYFFASAFPQSREFVTVELTLKGKEDDVAYNDYVVEKIFSCQ